MWNLSFDATTVSTDVARDLHGRHPLTAEQVARYRLQGFIKLKDVLSAATELNPLLWSRG